MKTEQRLPGDVLDDGSIYIGILNDGKTLYHLSLEPKCEPKEMTWHEAIKLEGCPTLREMKMISANAFALGLINDTGWYWSSTESSNGYAWLERFSDGNQFNGIKNNTYLVRCVRRSIIQSFDHSAIRIAELEKELAGLKNKQKCKVR